MAEPYLKDLSQMIDRLVLPRTGGVTLESRHFFSGAALYANGKICALLSPTGFALKLPAGIRQRLVEEGNGAAFRFFAKGPVKSEYVMLSESIIQDEKALRALLNSSIDYVVGATR